MRLVRGDKLPKELQAEVLRSYVYRHLDTTCKDDDQWLAAHAFYVTKAGKLSRRARHCEPASLAD